MISNLNIIKDKDDPRSYRRNRGGLYVIVNHKVVLHLADIEYCSQAYELLRNYKKLMHYLKQRKGALYSTISNTDLFEKIGMFEPYSLATTS